MPPIRLFRLDPDRLLGGTLLALAAVCAVDLAWQRLLVPRSTGLAALYERQAPSSGPALAAVERDLSTKKLAERARELGGGALGAQWTGSLEVRTPGRYTFFARAEGDLRLEIDGAAVIDSVSASTRRAEQGTLPLEAGRHPLRIRYVQRGEAPRLSLDWARDGELGEPLSAEALLPPHPDDALLRAYRTGRDVGHWLFLLCGAAAIAAAAAAVASRFGRGLREGPGRAVATAALAVLVAGGLAVLDDFGVSLDEGIQRQIGIVNYMYLAEGSARLLDDQFPERRYGPAFELALVALEKELRLTDSRAILLVRHAATFLLFCAGLVCFHGVCRRHFRSAPWALVACAALVLSPRILGDAFYNSKDLPLLSLFVVGVFTLVRFRDRPAAGRLFCHALASAALLGIRFVGLVVPALTLLLWTLDLFRREQPRPPARQAMARLLAYALLVAGLTLVFFPYLWGDPLARAADVLATMSRFPFTRPLLYLGQELRPRAVPWHYLPVWIGITTPLSYLLGFLVGCPVVAARWLRRRGPARCGPESADDLLLLAWCFGPAAAVVASRAVLYDGWRHLFFVAPAIVMVAVEGLRWLAGAAVRALRLRPEHGRATLLAAFGLAAVFAEPVLFMARAHPHHNVFFNRLAGENLAVIRQRFELDYWGLSYRQGLEHVARRDRRPRIEVLLRPGVGELSAAILPRADRTRLAFVGTSEQADYFLGNYRWHRGDYPYRHPVCEVRIGGASILSVFDLRLDRSGRAPSPPADCGS